MIKFYYCVGTSYLNAEMAKASDLDYTPPSSGNSALVAGLRGITARWGGGPPADPFPSFLDTNAFEVKKVFYPASTLGMGDSIQTGIDNVVAEVIDLPAGQKWAIGGFSQGAAVMSGVMLATKTGGALASKASDWLGGICFGNPRRAAGYRGSVGGTWSGAFDVPNSTTGGHGSFPTTGPYRRLTAAECDPLKWIEFAYPNDVFASVGDSAQGLAWTAGNDIFLGTADALEWAAYLALSIPIAAASAATLLFANGKMPLLDALGNTFNWLGGMGHVAYPFLPPIGNPDGNLTAYQIAIKFLESLAREISTAPILLPSQPTTTASAGWSTTLVPPAA